MKKNSYLALLFFVAALPFGAYAQPGNCISGDCKNGSGTWQWESGAIYIGEFKNDARNGYGYYKFSNGDVYIGEWQNNLRHGYGVYNFSARGTYKKYAGEWLSDKRTGMGVMYYQNDITPRFGIWKDDNFVAKYENLGCLVGDCYNGYGITVLPDGSRYEGMFANGKRHGEGVYYYNKGSKYIGHFTQDNRDGWGIYYYPSGSIYIGEWKNENREGKGTWYANGVISKQGIWKDNKLESEAPAIVDIGQESDDKTPPVITILKPEAILRGPRVVVKQREVYVEGTAADDSGVERVRLSGFVAELSITGTKEKRFSGKILLAEGQNVFWVEATDRVGNVAKSEFEIILEAETSIAAKEDNYLSEKRTALVVGNSDYPTVPLRNPVNDAVAVASRLKEFEFDVDLRTNVSKEEMILAIQKFGERLKENGGVGMFYYAGHGLQLNGQNFLVPVDANIRRDLDVDLESVHIQRLLNELLYAGNRLNIVILDACRDNPYASLRSVSRGLAAPTNAPIGTFIAYSTSPGAAASDGSGKHGLYTEMLLKVLESSKGTKLEDIFKMVRTEVRLASEGLQIPWENSSIEGDFYFKK